MTTFLFAIRHLARRLERLFAHLDNLCLKGHPEHHMFPNETARTESLDRVAVQVVQSSVYWLTISVLAAALLASTNVLTTQLSRLAGVSAPTSPFACLLLMTFGGLFIVNWGIRRRVPVMLRAELLRCGVPVCKKCGYCLNGASASRCPECGRSLDASIRRLLAPPGLLRDVRMLARMAAGKTDRPVATTSQPRPRVPSPAYSTANRIPGVSGRAFARRYLAPSLSSPGYPRTSAACS